MARNSRHCASFRMNADVTVKFAPKLSFFSRSALYSSSLAKSGTASF